MRTRSTRKTWIWIGATLLAAAVAGVPAGADGPAQQAQEQAQEQQQEKTEQEKKAAEQPIRVSPAEVVVTAPRMEVPLGENPTATTVVGPETLATMPRSVGAEEALRLVPGVKVDNQADGERVHLSIRGQGILTERGIRGVTVLLDGLPLNDPSGFVPDLFDVDWAEVQRIEVVRGPSSALYGGASSGGIISITTRDGGPTPLSGRAMLSLGSHGFWKTLADAGGTQDGLNYHVSASRTMGDGYRVHTAFAGTNLYGKFQLTNKKTFHLTAIVAGTSFFNDNAEGLNIAQVHQDPRQPNPDALAFNEYQRTRRGTTGLVGSVAVADSQDLSFSLYYRHTEWRESVPSTVQHRTYDTPGALLQYTVRGEALGVRHHFTLGTDLSWQDIADTKRPNLGHAVEGSEIVADQAITQRGTAFWAMDRVELGGPWTGVVAVRHDHIRNDLTDNLQAGGVDLSGHARFSRSTGRVGIAWSPSPTVSAYANWGQGFLPPATEELANNPNALGGFNSDLVPATSHGEEVGMRGVVADVFSYDVSLFRLLTTNDFGRFRVPSRPLETFYGNVGASRRWGLETLLGWFPTDDLAVRLAYTYSHFDYSHVAFSGETYRDTWLPNSPKHLAYLEAEYQVRPFLRVGAGATVMSRAYIDPSNTTWIGGYTLLDAHIAWDFEALGTTGSLLLAGRNLTGKHYIAFTEPDPDGNSYQPGPTSEVFAGVTLNL
jgi:iron complex outermembrane receptor protein